MSGSPFRDNELLISFEACTPEEARGPVPLAIHSDATFLVMSRSRSKDVFGRELKGLRMAP